MKAKNRVKMLKKKSSKRCHLALHPEVQIRAGTCKLTDITSI